MKSKDPAIQKGIAACGIPTKELKNCWVQTDPNWLMSFFASQDLLLQEKARKDADKAKHSALALGWSKSCGKVLCVVVALLGNLAWIKISLLWVPHGVIQSYFECVLIF